MSDYITLDELKGMSDKQVRDRWIGCFFPFDGAYCNNCVTTHGGGDTTCHDDGHAEFRKQAFPVWLYSEIPQNLNEIYALRLFYKNLYANNPHEIMEPYLVGEKVTVA